MNIIDKRPLTTPTTFDELPTGAVFEFPKSNENAEWFGVCMKIASSEYDDNAFDLSDNCIFHLEDNTEVCELNAHLVVERKE